MDFIKKDMPLQNDQFIDVQTEDPKFDPKFNSSTGKTGNKANKDHNLEDFDDCMFDMTVPHVGSTGGGGGGRSGAPGSKISKSGHPQTPLMSAEPSHSVYINELGKTKDIWFREEDYMKQKLEKQAMNSLKKKIAQTNRAAGSSKADPKDNIDSDIDPVDKTDTSNSIYGAGPGAVIAA